MQPCEQRNDASKQSSFYGVPSKCRKAMSWVVRRIQDSIESLPPSLRGCSTKQRRLRDVRLLSGQFGIVARVRIAKQCRNRESSWWVGKSRGRRCLSPHQPQNKSVGSVWVAVPCLSSRSARGPTAKAGHHALHQTDQCSGDTSDVRSTINRALGTRGVSGKCCSREIDMCVCVWQFGFVRYSTSV